MALDRDYWLRMAESIFIEAQGTHVRYSVDGEKGWLASTLESIYNLGVTAGREEMAADIEAETDAKQEFTPSPEVWAAVQQLLTPGDGKSRYQGEIAGAKWDMPVLDQTAWLIAAQESTNSRSLPSTYRHYRAILLRETERGNNAV